ncbi:hypothetical protein FRC04_005315 [Tulasnella sp. 424]|nr:hypothetical protein FRC04_005315 [Tulasnella sp. 424]KAG8976425.1 hypothetical protein FRC05_003668 [Tulasnella sp. 425]
MERYATWIERSKDVSLDISISKEPFGKPLAENVETIMGLIGPHMERWRSLQVERAAPEGIRFLLAHLKDRSLPKLEYLRLQEQYNGFRDGRTRSPEWESPELFAFQAPQLQKLEMIGAVADFKSPLYSNLYTLHLEDEYFDLLKPEVVKDIIHQLLQRSPHLKRLHIENPLYRIMYKDSNTPFHPPTGGAEEPLSHSSLANLTLTLRDGVYDAIIPSVKLPALQSFDSGRNSTVMIYSWHLQFLARSSPFPSLKRIGLDGHPNNPQYNIHLPAVLANLESLEELRLERFNMAQVANALPSLGYSCPRLRELVIYHCTGVDLSQVRSLVDTRTRVNGMPQLDHFHIDGGVDYAFPELEAIEKWLRERVGHWSLNTD